MDLHTFYSGKNILITGSTGFVGKVLLEKILRSLPETGQIYLLVRKKKGMTAEQRLEKIFESYIFSAVKKSFPDNAAFIKYTKDKIVLINGNLVKKDLDISTDDRQLITENVNIIINSAASVKFNDQI